MSKKYISQINNSNFVYPNNKLAEYDVEIIHELKENSVSGTTTGFSALYDSETGNINISFTYQWYLNTAEPFIANNGELNILSLHMMSNTKKYFKPWICVGLIQSNDIGLTYKTDTQNFVVTPAMMGQSSFTIGTYFFEIRMMGHRAVFPLNYSQVVTGPTPPPKTPCFCYDIVVTGTTGGEGQVIASIDYNNCDGELVGTNYTIGPATYHLCIQRSDGVIQYFAASGIDESYIAGVGNGNCNTGYVCD